jgi:predicted nucleic acid-binding protein
MPEADQVVSNTSPLLNLALISRLDLLAEQFESLLHVRYQFA